MTKGDIGIVILVKLTPVAPGEDRITQGFVEVWYYDFEKNRPDRMREKQVSYCLKQQVCTLLTDIRDSTLFRRQPPVKILLCHGMLFCVNGTRVFNQPIHHHP